MPSNDDDDDVDEHEEHDDDDDDDVDDDDVDADDDVHVPLTHRTKVSKQARTQSQCLSFVVHSQQSCCDSSSSFIRNKRVPFKFIRNKRVPLTTFNKDQLVWLTILKSAFDQ